MRVWIWCLIWVPSVWADATDQLSSRLAAIQSLSAEFTQLARDAAGREVQSIPGQLALARPNLLRWQTQDPIPQLIVSDGQALWTYDQDLEQVTRDPISVLLDSPAALLLNLQPETLRQRYQISQTQGVEGREVYQLIPNTDSLYQMLVIEFLDEVPSMLGVVDSLDQQTRISLRQVRINTPLEQAFSFELDPAMDFLDNLP